MRRTILHLAAAALLFPAALQAQQTAPEKLPLFNHLDLGITAGITGLGFDLTAPVGNYVNVRTGFSFVPRIEVPLHFEVMVGDNPKTSHSKFVKLSGLLNNITGTEVDEDIDVIGQPTMWNWSLLVDVHPFKRNKHWHFTAGFYLGPSQIAKAYNATHDMTSLIAVSIYNNLYDRVKNSDVLNDPYYFMDNNILDVVNNIELLNQFGFKFNPDDYPQLENMYFDMDENPVKSAYQRIADYGRMGMRVGVYSHDIVYQEDVFDEAGQLIHAKGDVKHAKGDPYVMEPDNNNMATAEMHVNSFKPYLGFGYGGKLLKNNDRLHVSFDAGIMFWGGTPSVKTHDGTDLVNDVEDIIGKVGDYVETIRGIKVLPVLNLRLAYKLF